MANNLIKAENLYNSGLSIYGDFSRELKVLLTSYSRDASLRITTANKDILTHKEFFSLIAQAPNRISKSYSFSTLNNGYGFFVVISKDDANAYEIKDHVISIALEKWNGVWKKTKSINAQFSKNFKMSVDEEYFCTTLSIESRDGKALFLIALPMSFCKSHF